MPNGRKHYTRPRHHPGSSAADIAREPDWLKTHNHHVGLLDRNDRTPGLTTGGDETPYVDDERRKFLIRAEIEAAELEKALKARDLLTVRDFMNKQEAYYLRFPENHPEGWRYVLHTTENFIKYEQDWPVNIKKREEQEKARREQDGQEEPEQEHEWRRKRGDTILHHDAHAVNGIGKTQREQDLQKKYTPQEIALLRMLEDERDYVKNLKENDGKKISPVAGGPPIDTSIADVDQFTPDNWVPRSVHLIRETKHPLNAEPDLTALYDAGLITPNHLHYVRSHGHVPHLIWQTHTLDVEHGKLMLSMDDIVSRFKSINIAVSLACDGNRRKELNLIRRTKGFNWAAGAVSCAYWKGPLLRDVLMAAGVKHPQSKLWVHFEGAEDLPEGRYATCIPLAYAMDPQNDVMLAYEMNNSRLPPDHGYPLRVIIPGYVGGRCVKWLKRIWVSDEESDGYYHIWDNRVLPSFILDKDSEFAHAMFHHPSTACYEQNLNSVIVKPAHLEKIKLADVKDGHTYRIEGFAYDGGGHEVQRVEVTLDNGKTWLYCTRRLPEYPIRHGNKFWTWVFWHIDVDMQYLVRAESIRVRAFSVFKNTQPENPSWNVTGMMNNCWYTIRPEIESITGAGGASLLFRHPTEPAMGTGGWMQPSTENLIKEAIREAQTPEKQFTREEIEKHNTEDDCWLVINEKVYDATSVLSWHPGGKSAIMAYAGKVRANVTGEFESIHDDYAHKKLSECLLGVVTDKTKSYLKKQAEDAAKERASQQNGETVLSRFRWNTVRFIKSEHISQDTRRYTFALPKGKKSLGLATCQHIQLGFHFNDGMVLRSYTPTRPVFEEQEDGTFDLLVKTYFPTKTQPGGTMSNILDCLRPGEEVEVKGPTGEIKYIEDGRFQIDGKEVNFRSVSLILGGSGITPGYQLIARILYSGKNGRPQDRTQLRVVDANKTVDDILLRDEFEQMAKDYPDQFQVTHVLSEADEDWTGERGYVTRELLEKSIFAPGDGSVALLCGPPAMIQRAVLPAMKEIGYKEEADLFGF